MHATKPLWADPQFEPVFRPLDNSDLEVDVAIIGAGVTGLTSALLLKRAGQRVAVFEAREILGGVTGATTSHLTQIVDTRYHVIEEKFGREGAKLVAESSAESIKLIELIVNQLKLDCGFERVPGYLFATTKEQHDELQVELAAAIRAGVNAAAQALPPLPFPVMGSMRVDHQAQIDPRAYLVPIALEINSNGSYVFEKTPVVAIHEGSPCWLETASGPTVKAEQVIVATHSPLNVLLLQTKIAHYQSYVISGPIAERPSALLWDMDDPYHYIRTQKTRHGLQLIIGGEDHKTGQQTHTEAAFERLAQYARKFHMAPDRRWSAQVIEPVDGLPFIGRNSGSSKVSVATGFSGNGMTFGTIAAMVMTDRVLGRPNPWASLYDATRIKPLASIKSYIQENVDFPLHLVAGVLKPAEAKSLAEVKHDEGKIVMTGGKRLAVYRDLDGAVHAVSSVCTHLGCHVAFNTAEKSWDCPCHGSRFTADGEVLAGPAIRPLERHEVTETQGRPRPGRAPERLFSHAKVARASEEERAREATTP